MNHIKKSNRKVLYTTLLVTVLCLTFFVSTIHAESGVSTVYHVYVNDEHIGAVSSQEVVEEYIEKERKKKEAAFSDLTLTINENVTYVPEMLYQPTYNNDLVQSKLTEQLTYSVKALKLEIQEETIGYFKNQAEIAELITNMKAKYVPEEILMELEDDSDFVQVENTKVNEEDTIVMYKLRKQALSAEEDNKDQLEEETTEIVNVELAEEVTVEEVKISPDELNTIPETMETLEKGKLETVAHTVEEGDTVSTILQTYDITEEKLLELNPDINKESLTIKVGQEIKVPGYVPFATVVVTEHDSEEKEIEFTTKTVESDDLYIGDEEVVEVGKAGVMKVDYEIVKVNGKEKERHIISEEIIEEPVEEVIAKGTKEYEVVQQNQTVKSSGVLGWPTAGGFITSHMGARWGGYHNGIDIAGVSNRTIFAADGGVVTSASYQNNGYGNRVVITHSNGLKTTYSHLSSITVQPGQTVQKGQAIGVMGATGNSTGVHLHFEVYQGGSLVNPMNFL